MGKIVAVNTDARFRGLWGQQDQLLHLLRGGRRHLQAPPRRDQLRPGERVGAPRACSVTVQCTGLCVACFLGRCGGTPRFLNDFLADSGHYFL